MNQADTPGEPPVPIVAEDAAAAAADDQAERAEQTKRAEQADSAEHADRADGVDGAATAEVAEVAGSASSAASADGADGERTEADSLEPADARAPRQRTPEPLPVPAVRFEDVVSGRFDEEDAQAEAAVPKRVLAPQPETPKLHKVLAQAGLGSRLEMEQLITEGRISVNNEPAHIGQRIQWGDQIKVNGRPIKVRIAPPAPRVIAYHKPVGEVVTHDDPQNRPTVFRKLPRLQQGKWQSVGRLDLNTEGLLLFTNSGELANKLMHPRFGLEREYAVRVLGALSNEERDRLLEGVTLDDGKAQFGSIEEGGGEGSNVWYRVTIGEGRYREVRRLFESVGHAVSRLIRIRYGAMVLPRGLKRGAWMELDDGDIRSLMHAAGAQQPQARQGQGSRKGGQNAPDRPRRGGKQRRGGNAGPVPGGDGMPQRADGKAPHEARTLGQSPRRQGPGGPQQRRNNAGGRGGGGGGGGGGDGQPDPMKTSFGYIGADSFMRQRQGQGGMPGQRRGGGPGGNPNARRGGRGR